MVFAIYKLFQKEYGGNLPGTFSQLVRAYNVRLDEEAIPEILFIQDGRHVVINDISIKLSAIEYAFYRFLAERCYNNKNQLDRNEDASKEFKKWFNIWIDQFEIGSGQRGAVDAGSSFNEDDVSKKISGIRGKFSKAGLKNLEGYLLPHKRSTIGINVQLIED